MWTPRSSYRNPQYTLLEPSILPPHNDLPVAPPSPNPYSPRVPHVFSPWNSQRLTVLPRICCTPTAMPILRALDPDGPGAINMEHFVQLAAACSAPPAAPASDRESSASSAQPPPYPGSEAGGMGESRGDPRPDSARLEEDGDPKVAEFIRSALSRRTVCAVIAFDSPSLPPSSLLPGCWRSTACNRRRMARTKKPRVRTTN
jgi:hypothetical protein